ncbi:MAG: hypothetical protein IPF98_17960 [Gemmatimonadetes bacterium]|nr:hypothetical protein [Gemmatimonadota bacterium]MCC6769815.1 hypothetical protein [Gemmatimonadaceae bacterium]
MSEPELPESAAYRQLDQLVHHLGEELAGFRRRALAAESRVRDLESAIQLGGDSASLERLRVLEEENVDLRARISFASGRTRQLLARVHFLRQQQSRPVPGAAPSARS